MSLTDTQRTFLVNHLGFSSANDVSVQEDAGTPIGTQEPANGRGESPEADTAQYAADRQALLDTRLKALTPQLRLALAGPPPNAALQKQLGTLSALRKAGDFDAALALLDEIEGALGGTQEGSTSDSAAQDWATAYQGWLEANEKLDEQLNALRQAILSETAYPEFAQQLQDIARVGLNALTGNHRVRLMAALQVMAPGDNTSLQKHGDKAIAAIAAFRAYLDSNERVDACEGNPWDVDVGIRDTLYPPLDRLTDILQSRPAPPA